TSTKSPAVRRNSSTLMGTKSGHSKPRATAPPVSSSETIWVTNSDGLFPLAVLVDHQPKLFLDTDPTSAHETVGRNGMDVAERSNDQAQRQRQAGAAFANAKGVTV